MRSLAIPLTTVALLAFALALPALPAEEIEEVPLTWKQAALGDGEALYGALCATCHGVEGKGDGPAAAALAGPLPDLTQLKAANDGVFPAKEVEKAISGEKRVVAHGTVDMPIWGQAFRDLRPDHSMVRRESFSRLRIFALTSYIESLQAE